jgi:ubiquinone/menaquinone biosynthesis C-methylase UbiE
MARRQHGAWFVCADAARLPFASETFDAVIDRGCFHYLDAPSRVTYAAEAQRVLRPRGRMLLRACLTSKGQRNDITRAIVTSVFAGWRVGQLDVESIPKRHPQHARPRCVAGATVAKRVKAYRREAWARSRWISLTGGWQVHTRPGAPA